MTDALTHELRNAPAFPCEFLHSDNSLQPVYGLTKRELFAAMAMQGLCANGIAGSHHLPQFLSKAAVEQADALITALGNAT